MNTDVRKYSVTKDDEGNVRNANVWHWMVPQYGSLGDIPGYWSPARDVRLRQLMYEDFHDFWSGAIGIAITKMASLGWDLESTTPRLRNYFQELLLAADDNQSWVRFLSRHLQDYLTTDNGAFVEVVRASSSAGSRILGLMHLDSLRCTRTGNAEIPVLYRDTKGKVHELKAHQVLTLTDMPSATETYHGVGWCSTSRALGIIRKLGAIERYIYEKVSGDRALAIDFVGGVVDQDVQTAVDSAKEQNEQRGNVLYKGAIMVPVPTDQSISHVRINFAELPDGFVYEEQFNNCVLVVANAIGLDVQDLQPLTGRPLGTATQSQVLEDKSEGRGLAAWRQQWTHMANQFLLPDSVTFAFSEKDVRDEQRRADVNKTITETVATMVEKVGVTTDQGKQVLADNEVIPQEFVPQDTTPRETISDTQKPEIEDVEEQPESKQPESEPEPETAEAVKAYVREKAQALKLFAELKPHD